MQIKRLVLSGILVGLLTPAVASADGLFTPFIGGAKSEMTYGFSFAGMGRETVGFEFDLGFTPNLFAQDAPEAENNLLTLMGNLIVGVPLGGIRPYAVGGVGLMRSRVTGPSDLIDISRSDFGISLGGGLMGFFGDSVGIRGDVRYFRSLQDAGEGFLGFDLGTFDFWRASVGLVFRF